MTSLLASTLFRLVACAAIGWLLGREFGASTLFAILSALIFLVWMLQPFGRFVNWLDAGGLDEFGRSNFFWSHVQYPVVKLAQRLNQQQEQLRADVDFFRDSFQALESGVIVTDHEGRISWANRNAASLVGIDLERDEGQLLTSLLRSPRFIKFVEEGDFSTPLLLQSPSNTDVHLEVRATRYRVDDTLLFVRDASERVKLEIMRQDFIANVSHELRTPLTVITGYLDTLKGSSDSLPPVWGETLQKMLEQSYRIDNMVNDLIWLSRLESVPAERDEQDVDLVLLLESILSDARVSAPGKVFSLKYTAPEPLTKSKPIQQQDKANDVFAANDSSVQMLQSSIENGEIESALDFKVKGVYSELRSAFSNLIQNAIKYTGDGADINVYCYVKLEELHVAVVDSGIGIDHVHIPRLTERFYRADESRTSSTGGTGLGLAIVKHVLARHSGRLVIQSELGKGSVFRCVFPASILVASE